MLKSVLLFLACVLWLAESGSAAPVIVSVNGALGDKQTLVIRGIDFGNKNPAHPYLYAGFDSDLKPSRLSRQKKWSAVENMEWCPNGRSGQPCARSKAGTIRWKMRADWDAWTKEGQEVYVFKQQKMNFIITSDTQNWKIWRMWPTPMNYPNIYAASNNGRVFVENVGPESGFWADFSPKSTDWMSSEIIFKASSAPNAKDGVCIIAYNGIPVAQGSVLTRSDEAPAYMTQNYLVHGVPANLELWNPPWSGDNAMWVDDVYADTSWARVMLANGPTPVGSTHWEIQVPLQWSDKRIAVQSNSGNFSNGEQAFLYVFDSNGISNFQGYPVTIGRSVAKNLQAAHRSAGPLSRSLLSKSHD